MDWQALRLSVLLAVLTAILLIPIGIFLGRWLANGRGLLRDLLQACFTLPLVLPPTVMGYYLLVLFGRDTYLGQFFEAVSGHNLVFSFQGILLASLLFNLPFAFSPIQRAFEAIPLEFKDAAKTCGLGFWSTLLKIELPLAWPGVLSALMMTAAHTLGEFGVVLMVGGSIPGQTKTISIAIYDQVQSFDMHGAGIMSAILLVFALLTLWVSTMLTQAKRIYKST